MKLTGLLLAAAAFMAGCETKPYDFDDPVNQRQQQQNSCREDPYQDACKPGVPG